MVEDPVTDLERAELASKCVDDLDLPMPAIVDSVDDRVNQAYQGWPDRLYLIDTEGRIVYAGGRGPFFFAPDAWQQAMERTLAEASREPIQQR